MTNPWAYLNDPELKEMLETGAITAVDPPIKLALDTATNNHPIERTGDQLYAVTDGILHQITVKLNRQDAPAVYFTDSHVINSPFYKLFISWGAQTGKTLRLYIGRNQPLVPTAITTKPSLSVAQKSWSTLVNYRHADGDPVEGRASVSVAAYTVETGFNLLLGGMIATCNGSCLQRVVLESTSSLLGDFWFDMRGEVIFGALSSTVLAPAAVLTVYIYNYDTVYRDFSVEIYGVLEAVTI